MQEYLEFAKILAQRAGNIMIANFKIGIASDQKDNQTPVTIADTTINKMVIEAIEQTYPDHSVLGEEESNAQINTEYVWVCDPIDGTIPYTFGVPTNTFSLALTKNGQPIVAVLYDPYLHRMYEATLGSGAKLNGQHISVKNIPTIENCYICLPGAQFGVVNMSEAWKTLINKKLRVLSYFSITYESTLVATGQAIGAIYPDIHPWDIAAIALIVTEAGGKVTDLRGHDQRYDQNIYGAIISNGYNHEIILETIAKHIIDTK